MKKQTVIKMCHNSNHILNTKPFTIKPISQSTPLCTNLFIMQHNAITDHNSEVITIMANMRYYYVGRMGRVIPNINGGNCK